MISRASEVRSEGHPLDSCLLGEWATVRKDGSRAPVGHDRRLRVARRTPRPARTGGPGPGAEKWGAPGHADRLLTSVRHVVQVLCVQCNLTDVYAFSDRFIEY